VGGADVVHEHQVARLPGFAPGVRLVGLVEELHDFRTDRVAVAEPGVEGQAVGAVDVHEVLADLGIEGPLVEEGDLVEPAACAGDRVPDHCAPALPGTQTPVRLPGEVDAVGAAVALDGAAVVGAERPLHRRPDLVVVAAREKPTTELEAPDEPGGKRVQHIGRIGHSGGTARLSSLQACEEQQRRRLERVAQLMVHAHRLVGRPCQRGVHTVEVGMPRSETFTLLHERSREDLEDVRSRPGVPDLESAHENGAMLLHRGAECVTVGGGPLLRIA
jgi:hypothetical protein